MESVIEAPTIREETGRNPDGTFKPGFSGNPKGRPHNPLKTFSMEEFKSWTDDQKRAFLDKIAPIDRWKMTEGNPTNETDITSKGESITGLTETEKIKLLELLNDKPQSTGQSNNRNETGEGVPV